MYIVEKYCIMSKVVYQQAMQEFHVFISVSKGTGQFISITQQFAKCVCSVSHNKLCTKIATVHKCHWSNFIKKKNMNMYEYVLCKIW